MKAYEIAELMETLSPVRYACDWDNVGMHVGRRDNEIKKILVTLDISDEAVDKAVAIKADMIISHHPLIFKGIKKVNESDIVGRRILTMAENHINCYCMHTNFDCVGGMAELAADRIGLQDCIVLEEVCEGDGIGRVGFLKHDMSVKELCSMVKEQFSLDKVALYGNEDEIVKKVAICPGSGKDEIELALLKGAKAIITGDVSYHYGIDSVAKGINVIDAGHYGIEHIFIDKIKSYLIENTKDIEVVKMDLVNPQKYI